MNGPGKEIDARSFKHSGDGLAELCAWLRKLGYPPAIAVAIGVVVAKSPGPEKNSAPGGKRRRGPRQKARGQAVASVLLGKALPSGASEDSDGAAKQGSGSRGRNEGKPAGQTSGAGDPADAL